MQNSEYSNWFDTPKVKESKTQSNNREKQIYDPEFNRLNSLCSVVQSEIEDKWRDNDAIRWERWKLQIIKQEWNNYLNSYKQITAIKKNWTDCVVLDQSFDKPEEAIKYANMFNFLKNEIIKHKWIKWVSISNTYQNWAKIASERDLIYADGSQVTPFRSIPDGKWDTWYDLGKNEIKLTNKLWSAMIKFAKKNNLLIWT